MVKRVTPEQLQSWGIVSRTHGKWVGSNAYALLTGDKAFPICVRCGVFKGDDKAVFVDRRQFDGAVCDLIDESQDYVLAKINMGCDFVGTRRRDIYELPPDALRELIVNAFVHRSYFDHNAPVFVAVYDTRVEISSPGGLPRGLSKEEAFAGRSCIRNHALAAAFNYMHYVEGWGSGFKRVNEQLAEVGVPPVKMEVLNGEVRLNVYRKAGKALIESDEARTGAKELPIENEKASNGRRELSIGNKKLPIDRRKLPIDGQGLPFESIVADRKLSRPSRNHLAALYKEVAAESHFDVQTASSILGMSERTVRNLLAGARSKGIIVSVPGHGKGKYRFVVPLAAARRDMV